MYLIRCDQCKTELLESGRRYVLELAGMIRYGFDMNEPVHLCSESCGAAWFAERAPTVAAAAE